MPENSTGNQSKPIPPYVAYKTFENFVDTLHARAIPSRIDRGVMSTMSGGVQSHLMSALRYFDFVNSVGQPTDRMKAFVNSEGEERKKQLIALVRWAYPFLFQGFDLSSVTQAHLIEQFEAQTAATGATLRKCVGFFLAISRAAGLEVSPYLKRTRAPRVNGTRRKGASTGNVPPTSSQREDRMESQQSDWSRALLEKFPAFDPNWSEEVQAKWFAAFERLMGAKHND